MLEFLKELNNKFAELDKKLGDLQDNVKILKESADDLKSTTKINNINIMTKNIELDIVPMCDEEFKLFINNLNKYNLKSTFIEDNTQNPNCNIIKLSGSYGDIKLYLENEYATDNEDLEFLLTQINN
jgi:hypothetical protein